MTAVRVAWWVLLASLPCLACEAPDQPEPQTASSSAHPQARWTFEVDEPRATERSRREQRPLVVVFVAAYDGHSKALDRAFTDPRVQDALREFVGLRFDIAEETAATVDAQKKFGNRGTPDTLILDPNGNELFRSPYAMSADELLAALSKAGSPR